MSGATYTSNIYQKLYQNYQNHQYKTFGGCIVTEIIALFTCHMLASIESCPKQSWGYDSYLANVA